MRKRILAAAVALTFVALPAQAVEERPPVVWQMPLEHWDATYTLTLDKSGPTPKLVSTVSVEAPAPTHPGMGSDVEQWRTKVAFYFPADQVNRALNVMKCESGGNSWADNPRSSATGLMQILASTWGPRFGYTTAQLFDPDINLYVASLLYFDGGWAHWNASRHCWG